MWFWTFFTKRIILSLFDVCGTEFIALNIEVPQIILHLFLFLLCYYRST